jgi:hypothetical protein
MGHCTWGDFPSSKLTLWESWHSLDPAHHMYYAGDIQPGYYVKCNEWLYVHWLNQIRSFRRIRKYKLPMMNQSYHWLQWKGVLSEEGGEMAVNFGCDFFM